ncbi:DegV family protein [Clostridium felsineum]|uniref:Uncharacterized protein n=1 Tax=Clostridium felsineum TaxID=36839 RepID=A0A1S8LJU6_9CLOT|nr:DegV family protein [Clostridium felsineum]MCR3760361.1 DegV family protein [Clostridium felsineum]URZ01724.1 hypothetical protein CLAUR_017190 [Clostridium felsineum]URZ05417.1 hypothetical protein CLROS_007430 [Clostridium felsineum]URZ10458.1 hypothetical protein CROST_011680 [Clostridium felsineum]URZ17616.1 hypothetical protein CLFE_036690 [Clostridium felsineum DSM 794]
MEKIKIVTDSTCDLPEYIIRKHDIDVLPLMVNVKGKSYFDVIDINFKQLSKIMDEENIFPTTSQVTPKRFCDCFSKYIDEGYKIICINMSSKMSGTYQSACIAKDMLETDNIAIIDSLNVTSGLGVLVLKACRLKEEGKTFEEIKKEILETVPHVKSALAFEKLDNLIKGGRLSKTAGTIGNLLGIKLILEVKDGEMAVKDKVRGNKKAARSVLDCIKKESINREETSILLDAENEDILPILRQQLIENENKFVECEVGCVVGAHSGTKACGIFFIEEF